MRTRPCPCDRETEGAGVAECSGNGAGKRRQTMAGSATQRGFTQRRLKVDVHEVAVV